jgi:hypothetical protein
MKFIFIVLLLLISTPVLSEEAEIYNVWHSATNENASSVDHIQCLRKSRSDQIIYLKGHIKVEEEEVIKAGDIIATLPSICSPSDRVSFYSHIGTSNNLSSVSILSISPKGDIIYEQGRNITSQDVGVLLTGISFSR